MKTNKPQGSLKPKLGIGNLKGGPSDLGTKILQKNPKKSSLYSQTRVVENHPSTGEIREFLRPRATPTGITPYFYMSSSLIYIFKIHRRKFQT